MIDAQAAGTHLLKYGEQARDAHRATPCNIWRKEQNVMIVTAAEGKTILARRNMGLKKVVHGSSKAAASEEAKAYASVR